MDARGDITFFRGKKFQSQYRKVLLGTLRGLRKFLVFEEINGQNGGYLKFLSKFWSHITEKIFGNSSRFQRNSGSVKFLWMRVGDIRFFRGNALNHSTGEILWELLVVSKNFSQREYLGMRRGISGFPVDFFRLKKPTNFIGSSSVFQENPVAKILYGCEGGYHIFRSILFRLWNPQTFIGKFSVYQEICRSEKFVWMREGDITFFRRNFLNHSTGEIHWEMLVVSETLWYGKKHMNKTGVNANFRQTIFVSFYRESALGTLRCFTKILVERILHVWSRGISRFSVAIFLYQSFEFFHRELFIVSGKLWQWKVGMDERRGCHVFPSNFFKSQYRRNSLGNVSRFRNFMVWKETYE